ncbi:glycosyl hydrolase family 28-related protein [Streptomyces ardesiacus]|uniref:glycosyl hydrolase family 28-related protein n=1 Tax=Streptomyces ardesiacus TaxID=285564 RepID=UPI0036672029
MTLTSNSEGMVSHFYGPDGVTLLYVDFGAGRVAMAPVNTSTDLANHLNAADPHGSKAGALAEINAQKGAPGGFATLDSMGKLSSSQVPSGSGEGSSGGGVDWLNVKSASFGAVGDGTKDDTAAIQAAINAAGYGGVVYFPKGVYRISQTLDLPRGVTLQGSHSNLMVGPGMTGDQWPCYIQAAPTFTTGAMITIIGEDDGTHPAINGEQRITNLMLDGSKVATGGLDGIYSRGNVQNVVLRDVCIRQMPNNGIVTASVGTTWPYSWRLHSVMVDNCHTNGMVFEGNTDLTLEDCQVIGSWSNGFKLTNCANSILTHCRAEWNGNHGFLLTGNWGNWPGSGSLTMTGCTTDRNGWDGVRVDASGNGPFIIQGLNTRRDGRNGGTGGGGYAGLALLNRAPVVVTGLACYVGTDDGGTAGTSPQYGVRVANARDVNVVAAYLHGATAGVYQEGVNERVRITESTTVAGNNYAEDRVVNSSAANNGYTSKGIYVPPGWGEFWKAKRDAAAAGGKARLIVVGGSASQGFYASNLHTGGWVGNVRTALQTKYGDGGSGFFSSSRSAVKLNSPSDAAAVAAWTANGSVATTTGTWTLGGSLYGPGVTYLYTDTTGSSMTYRVKGTSVKIYTVSGGGSRAAYTYKIDGGAAVTVPDSGISASNIQVKEVTGLTNAEHTVTITWAGTTSGAGQNLSVCGVSGENASGIVVDNNAKAGASSSTYASNIALGSSWNGGQANPCDLLVFTAGPNDAAANVSGDAWSKNVTQYLTEVKAANNGATDIMFVLPHLGKHDVTNYVYQDYAIRARGLAEAFNAALVDIWTLGRNSWNYWNSLGYWGDANNVGQTGTDSVHMGNTGYAHMASHITPLLMS